MRRTRASSDSGFSLATPCFRRLRNSASSRLTRSGGGQVGLEPLQFRWLTTLRASRLVLVVAGRVAALTWASSSARRASASSRAFR